jgi:hypothetical protein
LEIFGEQPHRLVNSPCPGVIVASESVRKFSSLYCGSAEFGDNSARETIS